jgi:hypothetical protein
MIFADSKSPIGKFKNQAFGRLNALSDHMNLRSHCPAAGFHPFAEVFNIDLTEPE